MGVWSLGLVVGSGLIHWWIPVVVVSVTAGLVWLLIRSEPHMDMPVRAARPVHRDSGHGRGAGDAARDGTGPVRVGVAGMGGAENKRWRRVSEYTVFCSACGSRSRHADLDGDERWAARHWCRFRMFVTAIRDWVNDVPWPLKFLAVIWAAIALGLVIGIMIAGRR